MPLLPLTPLDFGMVYLGGTIAFDYGVVKSTISDSITWVENTLVKCGKFRLPSKRELYKNKDIETVLIDVTEIEIERPQKNRKNTIREKRKDIL